MTIGGLATLTHCWLHRLWRTPWRPHRCWFLEIPFCFLRRRLCYTSCATIWQYSASAWQTSHVRWFFVCGHPTVDSTSTSTSNARSSQAAVSLFTGWYSYGLPPSGRSLVTTGSTLSDGQGLRDSPSSCPSAIPPPWASAATHHGGPLPLLTVYLVTTSSESDTALTQENSGYFVVGPSNLTQILTYHPNYRFVFLNWFIWTLK